MNSWKKSALVLCVAIGILPVWSTPVLGEVGSTDSPQASAADIAAGKDSALKNASQKGTPLTVISNVSDAATIQAILIPANVAKKIFGKEVAEHYAVIEVIISNRDTKASLVVHSLFMDDSNWLLRGGGVACKPQTLPAGPASNQSATQPCQVASIESRLVRGEALDAQQWTSRNWTIRSLTALGAIGAGFEFPFSPDVIKGISAFNGIIVPSASTLWPDGTIAQVNRISDVGFQTNKIIGKQSADIMVAFFPIERFLTASFRDLFLKDPAALFVPAEMLADPKRAKRLVTMLTPLTDVLLKDSTNVAGDLLRSTIVPCSGSAADAVAGHQANDEDDFRKMCGAQKILNGLSLNTIRVVVGGIMTVDVATVPATVYSVDLDKNAATIWSTPATDQTGTITGVYLTGGVPSIVDVNGKALDGVTITAVAEGSSDTQLNFKITVTACVKAPTKAFLVVNKAPDASSSGPASTAAAANPTKKISNAIASTPFELSPQPLACTAVAAPADGGDAVVTTPPKVGATGVGAAIAAPATAAVPQSKKSKAAAPQKQ